MVRRVPLPLHYSSAVLAAALHKFAAAAALCMASLETGLTCPPIEDNTGQMRLGASKAEPKTEACVEARPNLNHIGLRPACASML